ncbi:unnamed protein product [Mycena citricolor]|uniref:Uncharacterized protein n=1 Tax=Mycena citricolor TaxID=2018698 RepID=A0AAD2Q7N3_9AGAR|nr:unnamed protein product [Mycena citricolor]
MKGRRMEVREHRGAGHGSGRRAFESTSNITQIIEIVFGDPMGLPWKADRGKKRRMTSVRPDSRSESRSGQQDGRQVKMVTPASSRVRMDCIQHRADPFFYAEHPRSYHATRTDARFHCRNFRMPFQSHSMHQSTRNTAQEPLHTPNVSLPHQCPACSLCAYVYDNIPSLGPEFQRYTSAQPAPVGHSLADARCVPVGKAASTSLIAHRSVPSVFRAQKYTFQATSGRVPLSAYNQHKQLIAFKRGRADHCGWLEQGSAEPSWSKYSRRAKKKRAHTGVFRGTGTPNFEIK